MLKKGYKVVFTFLSLVVFGVITTAAPRGKSQASAVIPVVLAPVEKASSASVEQTIGSVKDPKMATLSAADAGHVTEIAFKDGQSVQKGQLLVQLNNASELASLDVAKAKAAASALKYQSSQKLAKGNIKGLNLSPLSQQDVEDFKSSYLQDKASVAVAQSALNKRAVVAPFAGITGAVKVSVGDYVTPGLDLVDLVNYQMLQVSFSIPEDKIASLHIGQAIKITTPLYPKKTFIARVSFMAPAVDTGTRTLACLAVLDKDSIGPLRPGLFVQVNLSEATNTNAVQVPEQALVPAYPNYVVYQVINKKAVKTPVTIGQRRNGKVIIKKGLKLGQRVVVVGQNNLSNGQAVSVTPK